ncbi:MAG: glycosyltransferase family 39 protein [Chloroflexota bacterium]|nr:glycosyltransferase family 39 protein [Chloroflexota bacterium]
MWFGLLMATALMFSGIALSPFDRDESQWIYTSRFLSLLRQGDFGSSEWNSYWAHTQPPLARYAIGSSLKIAGFDLMKVNGPWDFTKESSQNIEEGNMPSADTLFWARLPGALAASGAIVLLFLIGRQVGGTVAGAAAALWLAANPRAREIMTRAEADGLLICLLLLGVLLALKTAALWEQVQDKALSRRRLLLPLIALGVAFGLAAATKLTGAVGIGAFGLALLLDTGMRRIHKRFVGPGGNIARWQAQVAAACVMFAGCGTVALLVFVLLNPALYTRPLASSLDLFTFRQQEMQVQMGLYPSAAIGSTVDRLKLGLVRPLSTYSVSAGLGRAIAGKVGQEWGEALPVDVPLSIAGAGVTLAGLILAHAGTTRKRGKTAWKYTSMVSNHTPSSAGLGAGGFALVWTLVYYISICLNMGLDWDRYTLPLVVLSALWVGVGIAAIIRAASGVL